MKCSIIFIALVSAALAGPPRPRVPMLDGRIVGGNPTTIEQHPHQISLLWYGSHICGGSVLTPTFIVTAAHCTYGDSPSVLSIRAGSTFVNSGGVIVPVAVIYEHPQFDYFDIDFDITLLLLTSPLTFSASIQPIDLPYLNQPVPGGTLTTVTGWGSLSEGGPSPSQLQEVQVPIVSNDVCQQAYYMYPITDRMLCAGLLGEGGRDACQGDSGGPLITEERILVGLVSWGIGCARAEYPGVYASVPNLRGFITDIVGI